MVTSWLLVQASPHHTETSCTSLFQPYDSGVLGVCILTFLDSIENNSAKNFGDTKKMRNFVTKTHKNMTDLQNNIETRSMLLIGTMLQGGKYRIDHYLASGGFGNTYVVTNMYFEETYAMKMCSQEPGQ